VKDSKRPALLALAAVLGGCPASRHAPDGGSGAPDGSDPDLRFDAGPSPDAATFCALPGANVPGLALPDGFCSRKFASIRAPRVIAFAPNGDLFLTSPRSPTPGGAAVGAGGIYVLPDDNRDGIPDAVLLFLGGPTMESVHGLAIQEGELVYSLERAVYSIPYHSGDRVAPTSPPTQIADLSDNGVSDRWTHTLDRASDGTLYVSRGQYDNGQCPPPNPRGGAVLKIGPGHDLHGDVSITGCRNPMYLRCTPWGPCYAAELTGDDWGGSIGGEEKLVELHDGDDIGYPCCVDRDKPYPGRGADCSQVAVAVQPYPLHNTPFGFDWDAAGKWPAPYTGGFFVGLHGDFGGWTGTALAWSATDPTTHRPTGATQTLVGGFGHGGPLNGRVTDVRFAPDGRLFFTDDTGGAVYWIAPQTLPR
jgi:glucose/arabinose dehydrogenase